MTLEQLARGLNISGELGVSLVVADLLKSKIPGDTQQTPES